MNTEKIESFSVIGISVRTTNENQQAMTDIGALWQQFISENLLEKIPNKIDTTIYCIYTDYEKDHTKPYTTILGCRVSDTSFIPEGMVTKTFVSGTYEKIIVKGNIFKGALAEAWFDIWNSDRNRAYTADFEVYSEKASDPENAEVDIYIALA
ncbi:MAG: AraC family transcriptional regulator [Flavobacterium sp.]|nr:AraC family transcriptional regulator [Flavobacterium sp.]